MYTWKWKYNFVGDQSDQLIWMEQQNQFYILSWLAKDTESPNLASSL